MAKLNLFTSECISLAKAEEKGNVTNSDYIGIGKFHIVTKNGIIEVKPVQKSTIEKGKIKKYVVFICEDKELSSFKAIVGKYKLS